MATTKDNWTMTRNTTTGNYTLECKNYDFNTQEKKIQVNCGNKAMTGDLVIDVKAKKGTLYGGTLYPSAPVINNTSQITALIKDGNKVQMILSPDANYTTIYATDVVATGGEGWITRNNNTENHMSIRSTFNDYGCVHFHFSHSNETISGTTGSTSARTIDTILDRNKDFIVVKHSPKGGSEAYRNYIDYREVGSSTTSTITYPFSTSDIGGGIFYKQNVGWVYRESYDSASVTIGNGNLDYLGIRTNSGGTFKCEIITLYLGDVSLT